MRWEALQTTQAVEAGTRQVKPVRRGEWQCAPFDALWVWQAGWGV